MRGENLVGRTTVTAPATCSGPVRDFGLDAPICVAGVVEPSATDGPLLFVFPHSTVNGGARDIRPRALSRFEISPKMPARKNFITTITRVANSSMCA